MILESVFNLKSVSEKKKKLGVWQKVRKQNLKNHLYY